MRPIRRCRRIRPILESLGEPVHTPGRMSAKGRRAVGPAGPRRPERPWPGAAFDPRLRHQRHGSGARCRRWRVRARRRRVWRNKRPVGPPINRARTRARAAGFPREGRTSQRRRRDKRADRPFANPNPPSAGVDLFVVPTIGFEAFPWDEAPRYLIGDRDT